MALVADAVRWFVRDLNREPSGGRRFWAMALLGAAAAALGVAGALGLGFGVNPRFVPLGVGLGAMGASELVPPERMALARRLRVGTWVAFGLYAAWILVPPLSTVDVTARAAVLVGLLALAGYVWTVYRRLEG